MREVWASGDAYEPYVGRWSRLVAAEFLGWLEVPQGGRWLDVGCGTGALTAAILAGCDPAGVVGIDPAEHYVSWAARHQPDPRARFLTGGTARLPAGPFDAVVSGLVLNFMQAPAAAVQAMRSVAGRGGVIAAYVWDYAGGMELIRRFWDAAVALDPGASALDEAVRFPLCAPRPLEQLWLQAGLSDVSARAVDVPTVFRSFEDYWQPFLGGQGPAPGYCMSLDATPRATLREHLRRQLPAASDGSIRLTARAWAVKGNAK